MPSSNGYGLHLLILWYYVRESELLDNVCYNKKLANIISRLIAITQSNLYIHVHQDVTLLVSKNRVK